MQPENSNENANANANANGNGNGNGNGNNYTLEGRETLKALTCDKEKVNLSDFSDLYLWTS